MSIKDYLFGASTSIPVNNQPILSVDNTNIKDYLFGAGVNTVQAPAPPILTTENKPNIEDYLFGDNNGLVKTTINYAILEAKDKPNIEEYLFGSTGVIPSPVNWGDITGEINRVSISGQSIGCVLGSGVDIALDTKVIPATSAGDIGKFLQLSPSGTNIYSEVDTVVNWGDIQGTLLEQTDLVEALNEKENDLSNPASDGQVLSSTTDGVRSWVDLPTTEWGEITGTLSDQTDLQTALDNKQAVLPTTTLEVTNFAADAWITIATAPLASLVYEKDLILDVTAVTPLGTCTDTCLVVNYAYNPSNFASMQPQLTAFTSHSFNSTTTAENGLVLYQSRVGIIGTNLVIQVRKYKDNSLTIYTTPRHTTPYVMRSGTATAADSTPTSSTTITLSAGVTGYNIIAASASLATYSQIGTYAGYTLSNTNDKTNQWAYVGNIYIAYNSTYRYGWSWNYDYILKEINNSEADSSYATYDTVRIQLRGNLASVADATAFNAATPSFDVSLIGNTKLAASDVCCLVYSTSTSVKYIYLYVKLKTPNTHYYIIPTSSYQGSFRNTYAVTTGYCYFNVIANGAVSASLPTPAQGSVVYSTKKNYDDLSGLVPYTGATTTLNLGAQDFSNSGYINGLLIGKQTNGFTIEGGQIVNAKFSVTESSTINGGTHSGTNTGDQDLSGYTNAAFKTIAISGQSNVVADTKDDTLTLVAGSNITITTDASTDSITIAASGSAADEKVKYDAGDITAGYIADKFVAGTGISLAEGTGANENKLVITNSSIGISDGDKGDITVSSSGTVWTIDNSAVTLAKMANMDTASLIYRKTAGAGVPEVNTLATLKTDLGLSGTNTGDQDLSGLVPYTGATTSLNLGANNFETTGTISGSYINSLALAKQTSGFTVEGGATTIAKLTVAKNTLLDGGTHSGTNTGDQDLSGLVPYTGASGGVNLGTYDLSFNGGKTRVDGNQWAFQYRYGGYGLYFNATDLRYDFTTADESPIFSIGVNSGNISAVGTVTGSNLSGTNTGDQTITLTGNVTGSGTGSFVTTIANDAVTYAKMQNVSATDKILGRASAGAGDVEEITCTPFARSILDDANEATFKATVNLEIGTDVQAYNSKLTDIAGLAVTDSNIIVGNGTTWIAESGATARTSLGVGTGDSPQFTAVNIGHASDTTLSRSSAGVIAVEGTAIPKGTGTSNEIAYWSGTNTVASLAVATYPSLTELSYVKGVSSSIQTQLGGKQATLVSGTNIKTVNSNSLLGSGDISITPNATHTGDVTGATALTIDKTAITGKTAVTAVGTDYVLISDTSDSGNLKKALVSDFGGGVSDGDKGDVTVSSSGTVWTVNKTIITSKTETSSAAEDFVLFSDTSDSGSLQKCKPRNLKVVDGANTGDIPYVNSGVLGGGAPISTDGVNYVWLGDRYSTGISNATEFNVEGYQVLKGYARPWKETGCWLFPKEGISSFTDSSNGGFDAPEVAYGFGGVSGNPYYKMLYDSELEQQTKIPFEIKIPDDYDVNSQCYWHIHFSLEPDSQAMHTGLVAFNIEYCYAQEQPSCYDVYNFKTTDTKLFSCSDVTSSDYFPHLVTVHDDDMDLVTFNYTKNEIIRGFISLHGNTTYDGYVIPLKVEIDYKAGDLGQYKHREG